MKITRNGHELNYKTFIFSGGEISVKLDLNSTAHAAKTGFFAKADYQTISAHIKNSNDILELFNLVDAIRRVDDTPIRLFMPYVPYGRQDRVCDKGEAFSLKVFSGLINSLNLQKVIIIDPHSDVAFALFNNLQVITQFDIINKWTELLNRIGGKTKFISADAGANKKTGKLASLFGQDFIRADKLRDVSNGDIKETIVYCDDFKGNDVIVCDDILDGSRTFTELAKVCKVKKCGKFILYITHAIFSKGAKICFDNGIDEIWTTNSFNWTTFPDEIGFYERLNVLRLEGVIEV